ncbi:ribosomal protein S28E/S33 [Streptomyces sp. W4I9-2]|nr:ribosomal protein S28E/S33 [Streptomyces sp. W4I9-2]
MGEHRTDVETYTGLDAGLVVEVLAGSGRHGTVTVVRIR